MYSTRQPDFFADMEPTLSTSTQLTKETNLSAKLDNKSLPHPGSEESTTGLSTAMQYQPPAEVCVCECECVYLASYTG